MDPARAPSYRAIATWQASDDPGAVAGVDAADPITFLVSSRASYLTGSHFTIDGGLLPTV